MKIIGEKIFAKDADGRLMSRIGTLFFRTPGLVTKKGIHALQRVMWLEDLAKAACYSEYYLNRKFQQEMGQRISDYIRDTRLEYA